MNLKMTLSQLDLLPSTVVEGTINSVAYAVRRPMITEALKEEPNMTVIHTLKQLDEVIAELAPTKIRNLEETALFVLNASPDTRDATVRRNEARAQVLRLATEGRVERPRSAAHLEQLINSQMQGQEDAKADNFGKAIDSVMLIESCHERDDEDDITYDEGDLPEWIVDSIRDKVLNVGLETFERARRDLARNPPPFSAAYTKASAARAGALALLDKFEITEDQVLSWAETKTKNMEAHFAKLEAAAQVAETPVPTIDEPPTPTTTYVDAKTGRKVHRVNKQKEKGISSADMKAANGT